MASLGQYLYNLALSIDQLVNAILGGTPDESISSRVGRKSRAGLPFARFLEKIIDAIWFLLFREKNHCKDSIEDMEDQGTRDVWK